MSGVEESHFILEKIVKRAMTKHMKSQRNLKQKISDIEIEVAKEHNEVIREEF